MRVRLGLLVSAVGLLGWAAPGRAQTAISAPFVNVVTDPNAPGGPRVAVRAPLVRVQVGDPPPVLVAPPPPAVVYPYPAPVVVAPLPPAPIPVQPVAPAMVAVRANPPGAPALTLAEFAQTFRAAPGTWQATFKHPRTGLAVTATFTLPPGTPRVIVGPRALEFDYGRVSVVIAFTLNGGIRVRTI